MFGACAVAFAAVAEAKVPVGWNANAEWFMYAPSFAFKESAGAVKYRFRVLDDCHVTRTFDADKPTASLQPVWDALPAGFVTVTCLAVDGAGETVGLAGERTFWKNAAYKEGSYPKAKRSYAEAVKMGLEYLLDREANRYFLEHGRPDPSYDLNCYPAKMHSATIEAMCDYLKADLPRKDEALKLARLCADYLIKIAEPEERPLAGWPHTYEGKNNTAAMYAGQQMLVYPAAAGSAFLSLYAVTKDVQYLTAARRIAATYLKLQGEDGTWFLKLYEKDGQPVNANRLMPSSVIDFLERLYAVTDEQDYRAAADKAFTYIDCGPLQTWNWEGQFEDVPPSEPYFNLTKHTACDTAIYLLKRFPKDARRREQADEILRWAEDQFIAWEVPARKDGIGFRNRPGFKARWTHGWQTKYSIWHCPAVMEQYSWYQPIDASAAKLIRTYLAYHEATGDSLALAKARTLGDAVVNNQRDDGLSPTGWFGNYDEYHHWINCHIAAIRAVQLLDAAVARRDVVVEGCDGAAIQRAIDAVAAAGGGRVTVPAGEYPSGSLRLRSHVELHLEKGAVVRGGTRSEDYFSFPTNICSVRPENSARVFLYAWDEEDVAITGGGLVDGQGPAFFGPETRIPGQPFWSKPTCERPRMVQLVNCRNVRLQGVVFKDSPGWTMLIRRCRNVDVEAIRVEAEQRMINSDGIDFDGCRDVRVRNCDFRTGDDCLILRAIREDGCDAQIVCEDVVIENCRLNSACQCIRMGCPSDDTIRNVTFRDIGMAGRNGIYFNNPTRYLRETDEGYLDVSGIRFESFTGELSDSAIQIDVEAGIKLRGVRDILFKDFDVKSARPLRFVGNVHTKFERVWFENVTVNGVRQPDGEVKGDFSESGPLVRAAQSWETRKQGR